MILAICDAFQSGSLLLRGDELVALGAPVASVLLHRRRAEICARCIAVEAFCAVVARPLWQGLCISPSLPSASAGVAAADVDLSIMAIRAIGKSAIVVRLQGVAASPHLEPLLERDVFPGLFHLDIVNAVNLKAKLFYLRPWAPAPGWMYQPEGPRLPWSRAPVPGGMF
ncbi:hypothetical protein ACHAXT_000740 [Thalassiosira profunda]